MKENKMDQFINKILPVVDKFQNNLYVSSIMEGMMSSMPVLMASAVLQLIYSFPITAWTNFLTKTGLYGLFGTVVTICNMTALFIVFGIGRVVGNKKGIDGLNSGLASLLCFLIITPLRLMKLVVLLLTHLGLVHKGFLLRSLLRWLPLQSMHFA